MRRGRPRHDDVLTPREWEVLALLRQGLSNEAVATHLGISLDTAKYHVSEILGKLGVESREEAARWQGEPRRGWLPLPFGLKWPLLAVVTAGVAAIVILAAGGFGGDDDGSDDTLGLTGGALADFEATSTATVVPLPPSNQATNIQLTVCIDDYEWTRPSLAEQIEHIDTDRRYAPFGEITQSQFEASFYIAAGPGTGRGNLLGKMVLFSGLWTRDDGRQLLIDLSAGCPDAPNMFTDPELIDLFLFGYGATDARRDGDRTVITVEPRAAGFQAVQLRYPGPAGDYPGPYVFVDASGRTVGVIAEDGFWSAPP